LEFARPRRHGKIAEGDSGCEGAKPEARQGGADVEVPAGGGGKGGGASAGAARAAAARQGGHGDTGRPEEGGGHGGDEVGASTGG